MDQNKVVKERKFGRFSIPYNIVRDYPEAVQEFMCGMIILEATNHFSYNSIEYVVASELFNKVDLGKSIPTYHLYHYEGKTKERHILFEFEEENEKI